MNSLRISGYNPKLTTNTLLYELFCQGGPIKSISFCKRPDDHAIIRFQHDESVPYCLALFEGIELHGRLLRMNPLRYNKNTNLYLDYLKEVRHKFRDEYAQITPPALPAKSPTNIKPQHVKDRRSNKQRHREKDQSFKSNKSNKDNDNVKPMRARGADSELFTTREQKNRLPEKKSPKLRKSKTHVSNLKSDRKKHNVEKKNSRKKPSQKQRRRHK